MVGHAATAIFSCEAGKCSRDIDAVLCEHFRIAFSIWRCWAGRIYVVVALHQRRWA